MKGQRKWGLAAFGFFVLMSLFALLVALRMPPPPDQAIFDVLYEHGLVSIDERNNVQYGFLSGEFVFEKEAVEDSQIDALTKDLESLLSAKSSWTTVLGWSEADITFSGFGGFEPICEIRLISGLYDRGDTTSQRILFVVVRWEGRRLNFWERFQRWVGF